MYNCIVTDYQYRFIETYWIRITRAYRHTDHNSFTNTCDNVPNVRESVSLCVRAKLRVVMPNNHWNVLNPLNHRKKVQWLFLYWRQIPRLCPCVRGRHAYRRGKLLSTTNSSAVSVCPRLRKWSKTVTFRLLQHCEAWQQYYTVHLNHNVVWNTERTVPSEY